MAYDNPDASFFRPPPETFDMFADLAEDEDQDEEEITPRNRRPSHVPPQMPLFFQQGPTLPRIAPRAQHGRRPQTLNGQVLHRLRREAPRHQGMYETDYIDDEADLLPKIPTLTSQGRLPPKALREANPPRRPPGQGGSLPSPTQSSDSHDDNGGAFPLPTRYKPSYTQARTASRFSKFSVFASQKDKKKAMQVQRIAESEEALRTFLDEFPQDTRLLAKLPQLEMYKQKLNSPNELLNSGEVKWVYEVSRAVERRRVVIESKAFEEQAKAQIGGISTKRKRKDTSSSPSSYGTPTRASTGGKTIPGHVVEESDEDSDDSDEEQDGRPRKRGQKTISGCDGSSISAFNVREALAETSESEAEDCSTEYDESDESDMNSDEESDEENSGEENSGEVNSDENADLELGSVPVAEGEAEAEEL